jgi:hypothetical protein
MDNDDKMMMELLMQDEADAAADHEHRMMVLTALLPRDAPCRPSPGWFKGWEDEEQESTSTCRCSFA